MVELRVELACRQGSNQGIDPSGNLDESLQMIFGIPIPVRMICNDCKALTKSL